MLLHLLLFCFVGLVIADDDQQLDAGCSNNYDFDYVLFAIQWSAGFCSKTKCVKSPDAWGIHGMWPNYNKGNRGPQDCCFEKEFNASALKPLEARLKKSWRSLKVGGTDESFWKHEWTKHGTCAKNNGRLKGIYNYFKTTLDVFDGMSMAKWLAESSAKIVPSNDRVYSVADVAGAIRNKTGVSVQLKCLKGTPHPVLEQVFACLDKNTLKWQNCASGNTIGCGNGFIRLLKNNGDRW